MLNIIHLFALIFAGISVGIADALIKKVSMADSFSSIFKSPWFLLVLFLYLLQIFLFIYIFRHNWNLGIAVNVQIVFYSITVVLLGLIFFGESLSLIQGLGIFLALIGVALMSL